MQQFHQSHTNNMSHRVCLVRFIRKDMIEWIVTQPVKKDHNGSYTIVVNYNKIACVDKKLVYTFETKTLLLSVFLFVLNTEERFRGFVLATATHIKKIIKICIIALQFEEGYDIAGFLNGDCYTNGVKTLNFFVSLLGFKTSYSETPTFLIGSKANIEETIRRIDGTMDLSLDDITLEA